jgi:ABC-2 type transport system permease protein
MMTTTTGEHVVAVRIPRRGMAGELRAIKIVWQRELIRFADDKLRLATTLVQPLLFLFVLGTGLSTLTSRSAGGLNMRTFMYPGILAMSVLFTAMLSAGSIVWDREFGFLREMLVAPARRGSIIVGKCLGGATTSSLQGVVMLVFAGLVGVPYAPDLLIEVFALQVVLAFALTAFGLIVAVRITQMQSMMAVTQMLVMPMFFISGAIFPVAGLPGWLAVLNRLDPITYAVDPIRRVVFAHLDLGPAQRAALDPGVTWGSWHVPVFVQVGVVIALGLGLLAVAIAQFSRTE